MSKVPPWPAGGRMDVMPNRVHGFSRMPALPRPARDAATTIADATKTTLNRE